MSEIKLLETMDAKIWTEEFLRINPDSKDFGTMVGWFANAIMCGHDQSRWAMEKKLEDIDALKEILEHKQKIIAVMAHDLLMLGVNFDFHTCLERHATLAREK